MIQKAITSPVYKAIQAYIERYKSEAVGEDKLSDSDWTILCNIYKFLNQLIQTTLALESSVSTLDNILPAIDFILKQFEQAKEAYKYDKTMALIFNSGWAKMEKYYNITDKSPAYITAIILNPNAKWKYIKNNWKRE
jgi:hypothetical protein